MLKLSQHQLSAVSKIDPVALRELSFVSTILAKEARAEGGGTVFVVMDALERAFGPKEANLTDVWNSVKPNVLGGLAGGAVAGGLGYGLASRMPEESDDDFGARRRQFAMTAGLGGAAVGAAAPSILHTTGLDTKIRSVYNDATMPPAQRAEKVQAEQANHAADVQAKSEAAQISTTGLGATAGALTTVARDNAKPTEQAQKSFADQGNQMKEKVDALQTVGKSRADAVRANLGTQGHIDAHDANSTQVTNLQDAINKATAAVKGAPRGSTQYAQQMKMLTQMRQRLGSYQGQSAGLEGQASKARAVEAWLSGKSKSAPSNIPAEDSSFIENNRSQVGSLQSSMANRGAAPTAGSVFRGRLGKNTAIGAVLGYLMPHIIPATREAVQHTNLTPVLSGPTQQ